MLKEGADALVNKDAGQEELVNAIEKLMNDEKYISPDASLKLFTISKTRETAERDQEKHLTPREIEIIRFIADGYTNTEITAKLFLNTITVDTHRKNRPAKLQLKTLPHQQNILLITSCYDFYFVTIITLAAKQFFRIRIFCVDNKKKPPDGSFFYNLKIIYQYLKINEPVLPVGV